MKALHGTLTSYEMRIEKEKFEQKEVEFKPSMKNKEHKYHQECSNYEFDQELAQFARKLKHGLGKYKGNLPFQFFECGRFGKFSSKFPY